MKFSFIVPVYNRPDELKEFLESCCKLGYENFEVIIVEDGSTIDSEKVIEKFSSIIHISYAKKLNEGPSIARNYGAQFAQGDFLIFTDSDCILPREYLQTIDSELLAETDVFGGPDKSHPEFNNTQKAISFAMTSFLTTGGVRGQKKSVEKFYPRSFNMGIRKILFDKMGGFPQTKMHPGEDMVFAIELIKRGFKLQYIHEAFVYHKRRTSLNKFFKQIKGFGKVRIYISQLYPDSFKLIYILPVIFVVFLFSSIFLSIIKSWLIMLPLIFYFLLIFLFSAKESHSFAVGILSVIATILQITGYATGFISAIIRIYVLNRPEYALKKEELFSIS